MDSGFSGLIIATETNTGRIIAGLYYTDQELLLRKTRKVWGNLAAQKN